MCILCIATSDTLGVHSKRKKNGHVYLTQLLADEAEALMFGEVHLPAQLGAAQHQHDLTMVTNGIIGGVDRRFLFHTMILVSQDDSCFTE